VLCTAFFIFAASCWQTVITMKKKTGFEKFHKEAKSGGRVLKEKIRQEKKQLTKERKEYFEKKRREKFEPEKGTPEKEAPKKSIARAVTTSEMPLNKYIAHSGVCSRRDAAELVKSGKVLVNGKPVLEPGFKVTSKDEVKVSGKKIHPTQELIYILLNKPKDYLTTTDDPQGRKTVLDLIQHATKERVYPVGRLDPNTSGVLLLTNDGDLSQMLTHPSHEIKKVYAVTLDRPLEKEDFEKLLNGVTLEDGFAKADAVGFTDAGDRRQVGVELHSGKNRVVRRMFEALRYDVRNLDRVVFAGLTKKNVPRGKWRFLAEKEVRDLKFFKKGKK